MIHNPGPKSWFLCMRNTRDYVTMLVTASCFRYAKISKALDHRDEIEAVFAMGL